MVKMTIEFMQYLLPNHIVLPKKQAAITQANLASTFNSFLS